MYGITGAHGGIRLRLERAHSKATGVVGEIDVQSVVESLEFGAVTQARSIYSGSYAA